MSRSTDALAGIEIRASAVTAPGVSTGRVRVMGPRGGGAERSRQHASVRPARATQPAGKARTRNRAAREIAAAAGERVPLAKTRDRIAGAAVVKMFSFAATDLARLDALCKRHGNLERSTMVRRLIAAAYAEAARP
jgi:hypothetical protein